MNNDVVIIQLDRPRRVKFTHTSLKTLLELTGMTMEEFDESINPSDLEMVEKMAYCGLLFDANEKNETLTLEQIPHLLDQAPTIAHYLEKLFGAYKVAFGAPVEGNPQKPVKKPAKEESTTGKKASE